MIAETGRAFACGSVVVGAEYFDESPGIPLTAPAGTITATTTTPDTTATAKISDVPRPAPSSAAGEGVVARPGATVWEGAAIAPGGGPEAAAAAAGPENVTGSLISSLSSPSPPPRKRLRRGHRRLLRRVVVVSGPVAPEGAGRGLCVLPPRLRCVGNPAAVHAVSLDEGTVACPGGLDGACVLHLTTTTTANTNANTSASENADANTNTNINTITNVNANSHNNANANTNKTTNNNSIKTSSTNDTSTNTAPLVSSGGGLVKVGEAPSEGGEAVSYTHLTLPTICSV